MPNICKKYVKQNRSKTGTIEFFFFVVYIIFSQSFIFINFLKYLGSYVFVCGMVSWTARMHPRKLQYEWKFRWQRKHSLQRAIECVRHWFFLPNGMRNGMKWRNIVFTPGLGSYFNKFEILPLWMDKACLFACFEYKYYSHILCISVIIECNACAQNQINYGNVQVSFVGQHLLAVIDSR